MMAYLRRASPRTHGWRTWFCNNHEGYPATGLGMAILANGTDSDRNGLTNFLSSGLERRARVRFSNTTC